jgi:hypothetical protein
MIVNCPSLRLLFEKPASEKEQPSFFFILILEEWGFLVSLLCFAALAVAVDPTCSDFSILSAKGDLLVYNIKPFKVFLFSFFFPPNP